MAKPIVPHRWTVPVSERDGGVVPDLLLRRGRLHHQAVSDAVCGRHAAHADANGGGAAAAAAAAGVADAADAADAPAADAVMVVPVLVVVPVASAATQS